ncbi:hypothetical protein U5801_28980, partial [Lamprobacter modestohalophilus]
AAQALGFTVEVAGVGAVRAAHLAALFRIAPSREAERISRSHRSVPAGMAQMAKPKCPRQEKKSASHRAWSQHRLLAGSAVDPVSVSLSTVDTAEAAKRVATHCAID